jgi:CBS domain-containing protein
MNHPIESKMSEGITTSSRREVNLPVTIADIMTRDVVNVSPHQKLPDALALITIHRFHHLLVADVDEKLMGLLSDRDILAAVARKPNWQACEIRQIMTADPVTITPQTPVFTAVSTMLSKRFNCLPVINENGTPAGILTSTDILKSYQKIVASMQRKLKQIGMAEFSLSD